MTSRTLAQWLSRLETLHPAEIDLGLDRVSSVARTLDILDWQQPVVSVAGTNGKGSTIGVMESVLLAAGKKPGAYTSPHLLRFNERIRVGGVEVPDSEIVVAFEQIEEARGDVSLTYFEFATLAALLVFRECEPDVVLLEVGLGGRLDAVNIIDGDVAVITAVDLDHQEWLGTDRNTIAREKAGIMRTGRPVVIADRHPPDSLSDCAREVGAAPVLSLGREFDFKQQGQEWEGQLQSLQGERFSVPVQAQGSVLPDNICAALQALMLIGEELSPAHINAGLASVVVPGRRQPLQIADRQYLLDVAHNPASVNKLLEYIAITYCNKKVFCLFSTMADKDVRGMVKAAASAFSGWYVAGQPQRSRAADPAQLAGILREEGEKVSAVCRDIPEALNMARPTMAAGDCLVIFGSFFTVAEALPLLQDLGGKI